MSDQLSQVDIEAARKRSVTADDIIPITGATGAFTVLMGPIGLLDAIPGLAQHGQFGLPQLGTNARDAILSQTTYFESMWAAVIFKLVSKKVAQGFRVEDVDDSARRIKQAQQLILGYDGSYATGLQRGLQDYLKTNMGMVVEKARQSNARGSKVAGLFHLDALRCYPTGDPAKPIVYWSGYGGYHLLDAEDVIRIVDLPSPRVQMRGLGQCAADRAWDAILLRAAIKIYFREKITGTRNLALHFVSGMSAKNLENALNSSGDAMAQRGFVVYRGSTIVPTLDTDKPPTIITIPLAEVPDGFDMVEQLKDIDRTYAHCAGANVEEFVPAPAGLNTGLTAQIQNEAIAGQGMAAFDKQFELALTHSVLPGSTTFYMGTGEDWRDAEAKAKAQKARADVLAVYRMNGVISPLQMLNAAVDAGDLDESFLPQDTTNAGQVDDNQKLVSGEETTGLVLSPPPSNEPKVQVGRGGAGGAEAMKEKADDEWREAVKWAEEAQE